ncbi:MAG: hypothetical protein ABSB28_11800 [Candidatus Bathyarchaeia archaeon]
MAKTKGVSKRQINAIRSYARKGYSANKIQQKLRQRHIGMRRTKLLHYVRQAKHKRARPHVQKHIPREYRRQTTYTPAPKIGIFAKQIACYGSEHGKSKRIQMFGSGRQLYEAMQIVSKHPPKKQFLTISSEALLESPEEFLERGHWDARPRVES